MPLLAVSLSAESLSRSGWRLRQRLGSSTLAESLPSDARDRIATVDRRFATVFSAPRQELLDELKHAKPPRLPELLSIELIFHSLACHAHSHYPRTLVNDQRAVARQGIPDASCIYKQTRVIGDDPAGW